MCLVLEVVAWNWFLLVRSLQEKGFLIQRMVLLIHHLWHSHHCNLLNWIFINFRMLLAHNISDGSWKKLWHDTAFSSYVTLAFSPSRTFLAIGNVTGLVAVFKRHEGKCVSLQHSEFYCFYARAHKTVLHRFQKRQPKPCLKLPWSDGNLDNVVWYISHQTSWDR